MILWALLTDGFYACLCLFSVCVRVHKFQSVRLHFICVGLVKTNSITTQEGTLSLNQHDFQWPIYFMGRLRNKFQNKLCGGLPV